MGAEVYHRPMRLTTGGLALAALLPLAGAASPAAQRRPLPAIVFVSRKASPAAQAGAIPGLGPDDRVLAPGGRLMLREGGGPLARVRELLPAGTFHDASDPSVSPDGRRLAFAATVAPDSAWRIWLVDLDGTGLTRVTGPDTRPGAARCDDLDPCWVNGSILCFASTRYAQVAQYGGLPVTNLFLVRLPGGAPVRITSERNGAEEPAMDVRHGTLVFARWWHNRYLASDEASGLTTDPGKAVPADTVNLWHAMEIALDGPEAWTERLACGAPASRLASMAYQPAVLADGSIVGVYGANPGLSPASGGTGLQRFSPRLTAGRRLAGTIVDPASRAGYGSPEGLASPSACSPAGLPDGRILFAYDPGGRGDFGLYVMEADGGDLKRVLDLPGTLELDPAPVTPWTRAPRSLRLPADARPAAPFATLEQALRAPRRFRFLDLDVFAKPPAGRGLPEGPPRVPGARIRFYATLARPAAAGGDTVALVREAAVGRGGRVDEDGLPAGLPMFEQIVDPAGRVLRSAHGPAHVPGLNASAAGLVSRCIGCHTGHSTRLGRP